MNVVLFQCVYNEKELLPHKVDYCKKQNIDFFVMDNYSDDGTWEWLCENNVPSIRFSTDGMFSLKLNNKAILNEAKHLRPDWIVVAGADMFYYPKYFKTLYNNICWANEEGFNMIDTSELYNFYYTGTEDDTKDPRTEYRYYKQENPFTIRLIAKYSEDLWIDGDQFVSNNQIILYDHIKTFHYYIRGNAKQRKRLLLNRRKKAWHSGIDFMVHGKHYQELVNNNKWIYDKSELCFLEESGFPWVEKKVNDKEKRYETTEK